MSAALRVFFCLAMVMPFFAAAVSAQDAVAFDLFTRKGDSLAAAGKHADAIALYKAAADEAEKFGKSGSERMVPTLRKIAASYQALKNPGQANIYLQRALSLLTNAQPQAASSTTGTNRNNKAPATANQTPVSKTPATGSSGQSAATGGDLAPYMNMIQKRVKDLWQPPKMDDNKKVVVAFTVDPKGAVSNLKIKQSCGIGPADQAALEAVLKAAPFPAIPTQGGPGGPSELDVQLQLNYNVHHQTLDTTQPTSTPGDNAKQPNSETVPPARPTGSSSTQSTSTSSSTSSESTSSESTSSSRSK